MPIIKSPPQKLEFHFGEGFGVVALSNTDFNPINVFSFYYCNGRWGHFRIPAPFVTCMSVEVITDIGCHLAVLALTFDINLI